MAANATLHHLLTLTASSRPSFADQTFDCSWRRLAFEYAHELIPGLSAARAKGLHEALELTSLCGAAAFEPPAAKPSPPPAAPIPKADVTIFCSPAGSDSNEGSIGAPMLTLHAALNATRRLRRAKPAAATAAILLRAGTYHLATTLRLEPADSHLHIGSYNGEAAVVSGGALLRGLEWAPWPKRSGVYVADVSSMALPDGIPALRVHGRRVTRARYPNADPELDLFPKGWITDATKWRAPVYPPYNVPASATCEPHTQCGASYTKAIPAPDSEWHGMYQVYSEGYGGACSVYDPPRSPWCSDVFYLLRQFPEMHTRMPSGIDDVYAHLPNGPYAKPEGAHVFAWRPGHWCERSRAPSSRLHAHARSACTRPRCPRSPSPTGAATVRRYTWMFEAGKRLTSRSGTSLLFTAGGNQGGEGSDSAGEWFIENVLEELDAPNEFFFDADEKKLYLYHNSTSGGPPPAEVVVPSLARLIELRGVEMQPVRHVTLSGLTIRDGRPSYMEPRGNPSGGDWALERQGAVFLERTANCSVEGSLFTHLDGNALFLSGYNRGARVVGNEFAWLGQSAIASWGRLDGESNSGLGGAQPRGTYVARNWCHEIGIVQKQSSFYFQAITAQATLEANVVFNIPRAAINFNDGFGGGATMARNLLFNTCRESSDHGAFNSWDRLPYVTDVANGTASTVPAFNDVRSNFIVANYAADGGCLDNDDGSAYYRIHHNFCVYGGHKSDFDGHSKLSYNNVHVYPQVYGGKCVGELQAFPADGYAEGYYANKCVLPTAGATYLQFADGGCALGNTSAELSAFGRKQLLGNNTVYVPGGRALVKCGGLTLNATEFLARGYDAGTTIFPTLPTNDTIIGWARELLEMKKTAR